MDIENAELDEVISNPELRRFMILNLQSRAETQALVIVALSAVGFILVATCALLFLFQAYSMLIPVGLLCMFVATPLDSHLKYWSALKETKWILEDSEFDESESDDTESTDK